MSNMQKDKEQLLRDQLAVLKIKETKIENQIKNEKRKKREQEELMREKEIQDFKKELERSCGTVGHPKADLLFEKAWDRGESEGFHSVKEVYEDLSELLV